MGNPRLCCAFRRGAVSKGRSLFPACSASCSRHSAPIRIASRATWLTTNRERACWACRQARSSELRRIRGGVPSAGRSDAKRCTPGKGPSPAPFSFIHPRHEAGISDDMQQDRRCARTAWPARDGFTSPVRMLSLMHDSGRRYQTPSARVFRGRRSRLLAVSSPVGADRGSGTLAPSTSWKYNPTSEMCSSCRL